MRRLLLLPAIGLLLLVALSVTGGPGFHSVQKAEATETTTTWMYPASGGITVPGNGPTTSTVLNVPSPCTNCYITKIVPDLVYQNDPDPANHPDGATANFNNNSLDNVWLHHLVVVDSCIPPFTTRIFASGNERTILQYPSGFGYFNTCVSWILNYHIHNSSSATRKVAVKLVVTYSTGVTLKGTAPIWLDMAPDTNSSEYTIPEGYSDTHTGSGASGINPDYTSTIQGKIVGIGGHVHDYGISVSAYNNRLGDYICTSVGGYGAGSRYLPAGGPGTPGHPASGNSLTLNQAYHEAGGSPDDRYHIQAATPCSPTAAQSIVCVGDVIRLHTQYNNSSGFPILDAMGIITAQVDTSLPDSNGNGTINACEDSDGDGIRDGADNCPQWSNPSQNMPLWSVPSGDDDCDGFPSSAAAAGKAPETFMGTNASRHCASTSTLNDEGGADGWPFDMNDDQKANIFDVSTFSSHFNSPPSPGYNVRWDFNQDGKVNIFDVSQYSSIFNKGCSP